MADSVLERFWSKVEKTEGCWLWTAGRIPEGYGQFALTHDEQEPVTHRENSLRGVSPAARFAKATHCIHGHEFTPENTYLRKDGPGLRMCKTCGRERQRAKALERQYDRVAPVDLAGEVL